MVKEDSSKGLQKSLPHLLQACLTAVLNGRLPSSNILKATMSKALGYAIIAAACIVKMPQIWKIAANNSAKGLNTLSFELEQLALTVFAIYGCVMGLPFSAYGEGIVMMLQNTVILAQVYMLSKAPVWRPLLIISLFGLAMACVATGSVTPSLIKVVYDMNNLIVVFARVPQILQNYRSKSTGQLSGATYAANSLGCVARIFTSLQENAGYAMVRAYLLGLVLNGTILIQTIIYKPAGKAD